MAKKIAVTIALLWTSFGAGAQSPDPVLGKELYEGRCLGCHKEAPYGNGPRKATNLDSLRATSKLWDSISPGTPWTKRDLDDAVSYLNQKYYQY